MDRKKAKNARLICKRQVRRNVARAVASNFSLQQPDEVFRNPSIQTSIIARNHQVINSTLLEIPNKNNLPESDNSSTDNDFDDVSSCMSDGTTSFENVSLKEKLHVWSIENKITHKALSELLSILSHQLPDLPLDARTLLNTPRTTEVIKLENGNYSHVGLKKGVLARISQGIKSDSLEAKHLEVDVNIDGIPLYKSVSQNCWPILGRSQSLIDESPFVIGLFCGAGKPDPIDKYLSSFISEVNNLKENGFEFDGIKFTCEVRYYLCDAPARAYLKQIVGHNGRNGCERCIQEGEYIDHCMTFLQTNSTLRTDMSFEEQNYPDHHKGPSPLHTLGTKFISQFPLDPMHLIYLGVVRRIIFVWIHKGNSTTRLRARSTLALSNELNEVGKHVPREFSRKCRSLKEVKKWKATEFRLFVLYIGPVILKDILSSDEVYNHFMLLHCAVTILTSEEMSFRLLTYARELLKHFVEHCKVLYGYTMLVYNVHSLLHICDDVEKYGSLEKFSCFPLENALGGIKKMIRTPSNPLQQLMRRIAERDKLVHGSVKYTEVELKHSHDNGPIFPGRETASQFKKLVIPTYTIESKSPDNCCQMKNGKICIVKNILSIENDDVEFIVQEFVQYKDLYTYPCESRKLGPVVVSQLTGLKVYKKDSLKCKCMLLPQNDCEYVAMPLVHTLSS